MRNTGHSITEYAVIGFLVVLVAIPALGTLGLRLDELFAHNSRGLSQADGLFSLLSGGGGGANGGVTATTTAPEGGGPNNSIAGGDSVISYDQSALSSMASGLISTSVNGQDDLAAAVERVGVSGMAASRLETFNDEIDSRLASGEITAEQAGLLRRLSNQGYRIALLEQTLENVTDPHAPVVFDGVTYANMKDLSARIGWLNDSPNEVTNGVDILDPNYENATPENRVFLEIYQQVNTSLDNPETKEWVSGLAQEIIFLTEVVENAADKKMRDPSLDMKQYSASTITNLNSDAFCAAGEGSGNGAVCMQ